MFKNMIQKFKEKTGIAQKQRELEAIMMAAKKGPADPDIIKTAILDEISKCEIPNGYTIRIGNSLDFYDMVQQTKEFTERYYTKKVGFLNNFRKIQELIKWIAERSYSTCSKVCGVTYFKESFGKDEIIIFPKHIVFGWYHLVKNMDDTAEEITRQIVRHEVRHAWQFVTLRKEGILQQVWEHELNHSSYQDRATERDAYGGQRDGYPPIEEFVAMAREEIA